jgi:carboxymethylenebutenolidase
MCFDIDSSPPIDPRVGTVSGGSVMHRDVVLEAGDGNRFAAFEATGGGRVGIVVLPDVRGLYRFYEELALRFAERGYDAIAIDYFGRTADVGKRTDDWDFWPHVRSTTLEGVRADASAAVDHLRAGDPDRPVFIVGFCFGGSNAWHLAASGFDLSGVVGFYGHPDRPDMPGGAPTVISELADVTGPLLALQGGADPGIPTEVNASFRDAIAAMGVDGEVIEYEGAPHSFFDRKHEEFAEASADAWDRVTAFIDEHTPAG